jgi:hypothetical protein
MKRALQPLQRPLSTVSVALKRFSAGRGNVPLQNGHVGSMLSRLPILKI